MENNYNRLEVIDQTGRVLVINECSDVELQDDGKTLKIFLKNTGFKPHREDYYNLFQFAENEFGIKDCNNLFFNTDVLRFGNVTEVLLGSLCENECPDYDKYDEWLENLTNEEIMSFKNYTKAEAIIAKYMFANKYSEIFFDNR